MREFARELPHTTPADAWQRAVQVVANRPAECRGRAADQREVRRRERRRRARTRGPRTRSSGPVTCWPTPAVPQSTPRRRQKRRSRTSSAEAETEWVPLTVAVMPGFGPHPGLESVGLLAAKRRYAIARGVSPWKMSMRKRYLSRGAATLSRRQGVAAPRLELRLIRFPGADAPGYLFRRSAAGESTDREPAGAMGFPSAHP